MKRWLDWPAWGAVNFVPVATSTQLAKTSLCRRSVSAVGVYATYTTYATCATIWSPHPLKISYAWLYDHDSDFSWFKPETSIMHSSAKPAKWIGVAPSPMHTVSIPCAEMPELYGGFKRRPAPRSPVGVAGRCLPDLRDLRDLRDQSPPPQPVIQTTFVAETAFIGRKIVYIGRNGHKNCQSLNDISTGIPNQLSLMSARFTTRQPALQAK